MSVITRFTSGASSRELGDRVAQICARVPTKRYVHTGASARARPMVPFIVGVRARDLIVSEHVWFWALACLNSVHFSAQALCSGTGTKSERALRRRMGSLWLAGPLCRFTGFAAALSLKFI